MLRSTSAALTAANSDQAPQEVRRLGVEKYINAVAWNADGSRLAVLSGYGGYVTVWDTKRWNVASTFRRYGDTYSFNSVAYLPDGTLLTTAADEKTADPGFALMQWNPDTGELIRRIPDPNSRPSAPLTRIRVANTFRLSQDGSLAACINGHDAVVYETRNWSIVRWFPTPPTPKHADYANTIALAPDGRDLAVATGFGWIHFCKIADGSVRLSLNAFPEDPQPDTRCGTLGCQKSSIGALAFTPDGRYLAASRTLIDIHETNDGWTRIWRISDRALVAHLTDGTASARTASWSPNGNILVVGDDSSLLFWRTDQLPQTPELLESIHRGSYSVAFSSQGTLAASDANQIAIYR